MRSNLGGILASKPFSRRGRTTPPPLAPPGLARFHCEIHRDEVPPACSSPSPFSSSSATVETLRTCSKSLLQRLCHRCASAKLRNACHPNWSAAPFLSDCFRLAGQRPIKSLTFSVPFHLVYLNIATSTNFGLQQKFQKTTFGLCPHQQPTYIIYPSSLSL